MAKDDDMFWYYPDMDGNGKRDLTDVHLYDKMLKEKKERMNYSDEDEEEDFERDYDDDGYDNDDGFDHEDEDVENDDACDDEEATEDDEEDEDYDDYEGSNSPRVEAERQKIIRNAKSCGEFLLDDLSALKTFDDGEKYEEVTGPLRYLRKHPENIDGVLNFKKAIFERFPEVARDFDYEDNDYVDDIIVEYLHEDTEKGIEIWDWLLEAFPANLFTGTNKYIWSQITQAIAMNFDVDNVENLPLLVDFFEKKEETLFKAYVFDKNDDDAARKILGSCIVVGKVDLSIRIFRDLSEKNGGYTKSTMERILAYVLLVARESENVTENFQDFIIQQAEHLGIRGKKFVRELNEYLAEDKDV